MVATASMLIATTVCDGISMGQLFMVCMKFAFIPIVFWVSSRLSTLLQMDFLPHQMDPVAFMLHIAAIIESIGMIGNVGGLTVWWAVIN